MRDLKKIRLTRHDLLVGISASGGAPYVLGGMRYARRLGAKVVGLTCNPEAPLKALADVTIIPVVGPEVIAGSSRMKAGTAQKLVLNMLSTATMVRLGRVLSNSMINVQLTNQKLWKRAEGILMKLTGASQASGRQGIEGLAPQPARGAFDGIEEDPESGSCAPSLRKGRAWRRSCAKRWRSDSESVSRSVTPMIHGQRFRILMDKFRITGGRPLEGRVVISGAKNAALPAMTAALLTDQRVILHNVPRVRDISTLRSLLEDLGVDSSVTHEAHGNRIEIEARQLLNPVAPYELVKQMRASVLVLGPLVARFGQARVSLPGGCAIGVRPINLHLKGLEKLGASISFDHGYVNARADGLRGTDFYFDTISVTGTENLMMAATLAEGVTVLENAAREPEVQDLADLLNKMGAQIEGAGTHQIRIRGVSRLHGAEHTHYS